MRPSSNEANLLDVLSGIALGVAATAFVFALMFGDCECAKIRLEAATSTAK